MCKHKESVALIFGLGPGEFSSKFSSTEQLRAFCTDSNTAVVAVLLAEVPLTSITGPADPDEVIRAPLRALGVFASLLSIVGTVTLFVLLAVRSQKAHYNY